MGKSDSSGYSLPQTGNNVSVYSNLFSDNQIESTRFSAYAQDAFKFRTKQGLFTLVAGVRGSYWTYNKGVPFQSPCLIGLYPELRPRLDGRFRHRTVLSIALLQGITYNCDKDKNGNNITVLNKDLKVTTLHPFHIGRRLYVPCRRPEFQGDRRDVL